MPPSVMVAMLAALVGAFLVYAGARHQRIAPSRGKRPRLRWIGWLLIAVALAVMLGWFGTAVAIYTWVTLMMLIWTIVPLGLAWWDWRRKGFE